MQPDTLIPSPSNPQSWNRYSYVQNDPINLSDPTGHKACDDEYDCGNDSSASNLSNELNKKDDKNRKPHKPGESRCKTATCLKNLKASQQFVNDLDTWAFDISAAEASIATVGYIGAGVVCAFSEGAACAPAIKEAIALDVGVTKIFGFAENTLGYASAILTAGNDYYLGNTGIDKEIGLYVGKDTIVAMRNSQVGRINEAYVDFAVSASQSQYDKDRAAGKKEGGYVPVFSFEFIAQTLFKDWR